MSWHESPPNNGMRCQAHSPRQVPWRASQAGREEGSGHQLVNFCGSKQGLNEAAPVSVNGKHGALQIPASHFKNISPRWENEA